MTRPRFNRILLKLSGEVLMGEGQFGIDPDTVARLAEEIREAVASGHTLCLVVGGGNSAGQAAVHLSRSEPYIRRRAVRHMEKGRVVIFAAGTGNPFFTTDTAAALRAAEMGCDALFKGTSVDGVYDADPKKVAGAKRYETVAFSKVIADNLKVMDSTAVTLCRDNNIPIVVFNIREQGNLARVLDGGGTATIVRND